MIISIMLTCSALVETIWGKNLGVFDVKFITTQVVFLYSTPNEWIWQNVKIQTPRLNGRLGIKISLWLKLSTLFL